MAAPAYSNDLTTIATGDLNFDSGVWAESDDAGWDTAGSMVDDENLQYVKTSINSGEADDSCTSAQYTKPGTGSGATGPGTILYTHTTSFTVPTDGVVLIDDLWAAPDALNPYAGTFLTAEAGVSVLIGDTIADFDVHYVSGSDKPPAPKGGWTTYAVDPTVTPAGTVGAPTVLQTVGVAIAAVAQARGNPHAVQSVRYGRAEVEYTLGDVTTPATFDGYALIDNSSADRFNLLELTSGGFQARGLMSFGTAATPVYFKDSDKSIVIADDLKVGTNFNGGLVLNAASELHWTNISIKNIGNVAKYYFSNPDNAITIMTGGVFEDVGAYSYNSNSTNIGATYRRQELVTQNGGTFTNCIFDKSVATSALSADLLNLVTKCTFNWGTAGYGVDLGTIDATESLNWDNFESGYVTGSTGTDVGVTPTGDETILANVSAGQVLTINVQTGASIPSVANSGAGTVDVVAGQVTTTITVRDKITKLPIEGAMVYILAAAGGNIAEGTPIINKVSTDINGQVSDTRSLSSDQPIEGRVRYATVSPYYKTEPLADTISSSNGLNLNAYMISDE